MPDNQSWTWVRDTSTGHCYDLPTVQLERADGHLPGVQVIANKPKHVGPWPRRPKHHTDLAGQPVKNTSTKTPAAPASGEPAAPADGPADDNEEQ